MKILFRLLREPLLHFLVIGGLIFQLSGPVVKSGQAPTDKIVVGPERIDQLVKGFRSVWRRLPTEDERRALIDGFVREEVYYREALALGLDRNDTIVRRRLMQKMEFLADTGADLLKPAPGELEGYYDANKEAYRTEPKLAFEQIFLGEHVRPDKVAKVLGKLQSETLTNISALGERTLLPARLRLSPPSVIDGMFGQGFFTRLAELKSGIWAGPVTSAYGSHLVNISQTLPAGIPPLEEVHDAVLRDWKADKAAKIRELQYTRLRDRYVIEIQKADSPSLENR